MPFPSAQSFVQREHPALAEKAPGVWGFRPIIRAGLEGLGFVASSRILDRLPADPSCVGHDG